MFTGKKTKIICTMGPATEDDDVLRELIRSGMNIARFNFSHGSHEYHRNNVERVRRIAKELGANVAILLDTKGPEIRTGLLEGGHVQLETGAKVTVTTDMSVQGTAERFALDYEQLPQDVTRGSIILIDDGLIELTVESVEGTEMHCVVDNGGELGEHKGVNVPNAKVNLPAVTLQDRKDLIFGCELGVDAVAASFVRSAAGVEEIKEILADHGGDRICVLSKIECAEGVENFDEILHASNGIMVARGDLGVEVPVARVPHLQKEMIEKCNRHYKTVIVATQMLDSMIRNPRPTRAEVTDVANAVLDGTDCIMLSGETAAGAYPVEAVQTMTSICLETEKFVHERNTYVDRGGARNVNGSIGCAAAEIANRVNAKAIVCPTQTGRTARLISKFRSHEIVIATSASPMTVRHTCFYWGVEGFLVPEQPTLSTTINAAIELAKSRNYVAEDDYVVVTAGDPATSPKQGTYTTSTNLVMVAQVH